MKFVKIIILSALFISGTTVLPQTKTGEGSNTATSSSSSEENAKTTKDNTQAPAKQEQNQNNQEKQDTQDNQEQANTLEKQGESTTTEGSSKTYLMATGFRGGTYHQIAKSLAKNNILSVNAIPSGGSIQNIKMIRDHQADFAIAQLDILVNFALRRDRIKKNVKIVLPIYREEVHIIARKNFYSLDEFEEATISIGPKSSGSYATGRILLNALGLDESLVYLDYSDPNYALSLLKNKKIDAMIVVAGAPVQLFSKLKPSFGDRFKLLPVSQDLYKTLTGERLPYVLTTIPAKTYAWQPKAVQTLAVGSAIIVRADMDDSVVEKLIQDIFSRQADLIKTHPKWKELQKSAVKTFATIYKHFLHPAAYRALKNIQ
ncbi:MAG: TAXI family TRAP transporter solute-binding subunit [Candidatus Hydrogenedentota bacterium]|nr:MAG: TAXI family TRAP transporter solute-binding subunit [Candidatus Hydrogenedentota bacterium]